MRHDAANREWGSRLSQRAHANRLSQLLSLLRTLNWNQAGGVQGRFDVWVPTEHSRADPDTRIFLPANADLVDFEEMLDRAWQRLEDACSGEDRRIVQRLTQGHTAFDSVEWRTESFAPAGAIAWSKGMSLLASAQNQLYAAARAIPLTGMKKSGKMQRKLPRIFMDSTLMGQTQIGSYIVSALTPRDHVLLRVSEDSAAGEITLFDGATKVLTNSHVVAAFNNGIETLRTAIDEYKRRRRPEVFEEAGSHGVTLGFVTSVQGAVEHSPIEITVTSGPPEKSFTSRVSFDPEDKQVLSGVSHYLEYVITPRVGTFAGQVELLQRKNGTRIRFRTIVDGRPLTLAAELSEADYEVALEAHRVVAPVSIHGELLQVRGQRPMLTNVTSIKRLDQEPLFP